MKTTDHRIIQDADATFVCRRYDDKILFGRSNKQLRKLSRTSELHYVKPPENMIVIDFDLRGEERPDKKAYGFQWSCPNGKIVRLTVSVEDPGDGYSETQNKKGEEL